MNPEQLIEFIRSQLIQGKSRVEIEQILRLNNINEKEIAIAFNAAEWQKEQNVPSPTIQTSKSHFVLITILIILLLASGAGAYVTLYQPDLLNKLLGNNPISIPETPAITEALPIEPEPVINETSRWKTYRNDEYGFEFKYPVELTEEQSGHGEIVLLTHRDAKGGIAVFVEDNRCGYNDSDQEIRVNQDAISFTFFGKNIQTEHNQTCIDIVHIDDKLTYIHNPFNDDPYRNKFQESIFESIFPTFRFTATSTTATSTPEIS